MNSEYNIQVVRFDGVSVSHEEQKGVLENLRAENIQARDGVLADGDFKHEVQWYAWKVDMKGYSLEWPDHAFIVNRRGEEPYHEEVAVFHRGWMEAEWVKVIHPSPEDLLHTIHGKRALRKRSSEI